MSSIGSDVDGGENRPLSEDLMIGAEAIATWLGVPARKIFYMGETGQLPLFKIGGKVAARKSTIMRRIADLENAGKIEAA
jgi:hypothetical protein